jgi:hypothetical protein
VKGADRYYDATQNRVIHNVLRSSQAARVGRARSEVGQAGKRVTGAAPAKRLCDGLAHLHHRRQRSDRHAGKVKFAQLGDVEVQAEGVEE